MLVGITPAAGAIDSQPLPVCIVAVAVQAKPGVGLVKAICCVTTPGRPAVPVRLPLGSVALKEGAAARTTRIDWPAEMYRLPAGSVTTSFAWRSPALAANPPSPPLPPPATVVMMPLAATRRTRLLPVSAMIRFPALSNVRRCGWLNSALVAGPPSPEDPAVPLPATVVMMPLLSILRIRLFRESAIYTLPAPSRATPIGRFRLAEVAGPPSPENPAVPVPAMVEMIPAELTLRMRWPPESPI